MRPRRGWPLLLLVILVVAVAALEIWLLVQASHWIGVLPILLLLLGEVVVGGWLMKRGGSRAWQALLNSFSTGRLPGGELADAALVLVGGALLMLPGFVTDLVALVFLLPITRPLARRLIAYFVARRVLTMANSLAPLTGLSGASTVIRGETVDDPAPEGPSAPVVIRGEVTDEPSRE